MKISDFDVLRRPVITEKSNFMMGDLHQYVFEVARESTRQMVKEAVETLFDVTVLQVNIINVPAKQKPESSQPPCCG